MNPRINEIQARLAAINTEIDAATGDALTALEAEVRSLQTELATLQAEAQTRQQLRSNVANGLGVTIPAPAAAPEMTAEQRSAQKFIETRHMEISAEESRSVLISGGTLLTPTKIEGINDIPGVKVSSIIDQVKVVNCVGMGSNKVAYVATEMGEAATQTEGDTVSDTEPTFGTVTITPESELVLSYISKQAQKQTPLQYKAKVQSQALIALRKKAASIVTKKLVASELNTKLVMPAVSKKGAIDEKTLRTIVMSYGGDESIIGGAVLYLTKADLTAFGDVRGTNEKKAVYEITPSSSNPNTGTIKDGGLVVNYCINSNLNTLSGTAQPASSGKDLVTMIYGAPGCFELDLFSDYAIAVSDDFKFDKLMTTIRGDVELGGDVVVKGGFVAVTLPKATA